MTYSMRHRRALACSLVLAASLAACGNEPGPRAAADGTGQERIRVGTEADAKEYYEKLDSLLPQTKKATLDELLSSLGYDGLTAFDVERLAPDTLMDPAKLGADAPKLSPPTNKGDILATRFFAPKIVNYQVEQPADHGVGWRKLVRLNARTDSPAAKDGVSAAHLLFNYVGKGADIDVFKAGARSQNNQVMFIGSGGPSSTPFARWSVYGEVVAPGQGGARILSLRAPFDAPRLGGNADYYVPDACADCHDSDLRAKLNFLDTDHWIDRSADSDFAGVFPTSKLGVLYDADPSLPPDDFKKAFERAFDVVVELNKEIATQNEAIGVGGRHLKAVKKWNENHKDGQRAHVPLTDRSLGQTPWNTDLEPDRELLPLLNQYCYRCHSTIRYSLFDRDAVFDNLDEIKERLRINPKSPVERERQRRMPQDRLFSEEQIRRLETLLDAMK